ncbi:hypothetical protein LV779_05170 [Streptomyces thinghirensis]|nr:hypothetical protein [Streptomyces thinghirensis]
MHGGGTVALRTRVTGNQAVVEVTDEGRRPGRPGGADLRARDQRAELDGHRPGRRPRPGRGGRRPAGAPPGPSSGVRPVPVPHTAVEEVVRGLGRDGALGVPRGQAPAAVSGGPRGSVRGAHPP